jgi:uncharacterized protein (UPF0332 family)
LTKKGKDYIIKTIMKQSNYLSQAEHFLYQAEEELNKGDLRQAGEKYWGAATQAVKAFAEKEGWRHDGHAWLFETVSKISQEEKDDTLKREFGLAGMLHTNFYEGWLTEDEVKDYGLQAKGFVDKIGRILKNESLFSFKEKVLKTFF